MHDAHPSHESEAQRYTRRNILRSEFMYGRGFQSPGGIEVVAGFCQRLNLQPGMRALEIGSGLGGSAFYLAKQHGLRVLGLDAAAAMVELGSERCREDGIDGVSFVHADICTVALDEASFDLVWTRDCVLYIPDKAAVWRQVARCLKPGGQLLVADFARGSGELSPGFRSYVDDCGYHLQTLDDYADALSAAGLTITTREDATPAFMDGLRAEQAMLEQRREVFLAEFGPDDYDHLMQRWDRKIASCEAGELAWALFVAQRPSSERPG